MEVKVQGRRWLFLAPLILALLVVWYRWSVPGVSADAVTYLQIARNILSGDGLGWQALWACPLQSIMIAGVSLFGFSLQAAAGIVSATAHILLTLAVYFLGTRVEGIRTGLAASVLTALSPHLLFTASSAEPESLFTFTLILSLLLFLQTLERDSIFLAAGAGVSFCATYLSRSEGFLVWVLVVSLSALLRWRALREWRKAAVPIVTVAVFFAVASPYLLFLEKNYGRLVISPKSSYVLIWMKSRIYHDNDKGEMGNEELWGLSADGKRLRWMEPKGVGDLVSFLMSHPEKSLRVYLYNLSLEIPGRIPNNSGMERYPQLVPVAVGLLAVYGGLVSWGTRSRETKGVVLAPLLILLILPVFTEGWWKYLVAYQPLVLLTAAVGAVHALNAVSVRFPGGRWRGDAVLAIMVAALALRFVFSYVPLLGRSVAPPPNADINERVAVADEQKKAGEWAVAQFGQGRNYMVPWSKLAYWLDGKWTAFPVAPPGDLLDYGRRQGAEFVVIEFRGAASRDDVIRPFPGVEFVGAYASEKIPYVAAFYRIF